MGKQFIPAEPGWLKLDAYMGYSSATQMVMAGRPIIAWCIAREAEADGGVVFDSVPICVDEAMYLDAPQVACMCPGRRVYWDGKIFQTPSDFWQAKRDGDNELHRRVMGKE